MDQLTTARRVRPLVTYTVITVVACLLAVGLSLIIWWMLEGSYLTGGVAGLVGALVGFGAAHLVLGKYHRSPDPELYARMVEAFPAVGMAARAVQRVPVWSTDATDPVSATALHDEVESAAEIAAFYASPPVSEALNALVTASAEVVDQIATIRKSTRPGHQNQIDQRHLPAYQDAVDALDKAIERFRVAARADMGC